MKNLKDILQLLPKYQSANGKSPKLIAVSKTKPVEKIEEAYSLGARSFGENYWQEAIGKIDRLQSKDIEWHFIGVLQTKKIKDLVQYFDWIQTVEAQKHLLEIEKRSDQVKNVLIEVNISGEASKAGCSLAELDELLEVAKGLNKVRVCGIMIMPPLSDRPENSRHYFIQARELLDSKAKKFPQLALTELSMGTSSDYTVALEEGATMIRLGTSLFGKRD